MKMKKFANLPKVKFWLALVVSVVVLIPLLAANTARAIRVQNAVLQAGQTATIPIQMDAQGDESAVGFTLNFNPVQIQISEVVLGSGASGATLLVNPNQTSSGRLVIGVGRNPGQVFSAGTLELVRVTVTVIATSGTATIGFSNSPVVQEVSDVRGNVLPASFSSGAITINSPPVANSQNVNAVEDQSQGITLTATDANGQNLTFSIVSNPTKGALIGSPPNLTYVPQNNQNGPDSFTFQANDGLASSATATVSISIAPVNDSPSLASISNQTIAEGSTLTFTASANDPDGPTSVLTFSLAAGTPPGATINPATGAISWTPTEAQGPGTFTINVQVADNGSPTLSATQSISVTVTEANSPPALAAIAPQTVTEGNALTFTATAVDSDVPPNPLTFSLGPGAPAGASINPSSGAFAWTPTEAQGPGNFTISIQVTDGASANSTSSQTFTVTVNEANSPPVLAPISDQTVRAGKLMTVTALATDPDLPANGFAFSLDPGAPPGAVVNPTTGVITWTPPASSQTTAHVITVRVTDNGTPSASDTESFNVVVNSSNQTPVIPVIPSQNVEEGRTLSLTITATDPDLPPNQLAYRLGRDAPAGLSLDAATGLLTWTPTEPQGPSNVTVSIQVVDNGIPPLTAERTMVINVTEVNAPPVVAPLINRTVLAGTALTFTVTANDLDLPANVITFSLGPDAPAGASINPATGAFSWTPSLAQGGTTNVIAVTGRDNGTPPLSDTKTFTVVVAPSNTAPAFSPIPDQTAAEGAPFTFTAVARDTDLPINRLTYSLGPGAPAGMSIDPGTGVISWTPNETQGPGTNRVELRVLDDGVPPLGGQGTVVIVVNEINTPPNLAPIPNQAAIEGQPLTFTAAANDLDIPANAIQFSLGPGAPFGASINPITGAFTWTPTEAQGPSTNVVTVIATDNGLPSLSANRTVTIVVADDNGLPVLSPIPPQTVAEGSPLTFTATATDLDVPAQTLAFSLAPGAPVGAAINPATGIFTWTPTEAQGPGTVTARVRVSDNGVPPLAAEQDVPITVTEVNTRPNLAPIADQRVREGGLLTFTAAANDPDIPANIIQFSLGPGAPAGASINGASGVFTWTPTAAQTPSTNVITVVAADNGVPSLATNRTFTVVAFGDNRPPVIGPIAQQTIAEGSEISFTVTATDVDVPAQILTFGLAPGAPAGAEINPATGVFRWVPTEAQGPSTNVFGIRVTDSGTVPERSINIVTIVVTESNAAPVLRPFIDQTITGGETLRLVAEAVDSDVPRNLLTFSLDPGAPAGMTINSANGAFLWTPTPAQTPSTNQVTVRVTDNGAPALSATSTFIVAVRGGINQPPTISAIANQTTRENTPTSPIVFSINDPDTPLANLKLIASSFNTALVPDANIVFAGAGTNRTVTITPAPNTNGVVNITIIVEENTGGRATSSFALTITRVQPTIRRQPQPVEMVVGGQASFTVLATGSGPLLYEWRRNGTPITGETNSVLNFPNVQETDEGDYNVEVRNAVGAVLSSVAKLSANLPLRITSQPVSQSVLAGAEVNFLVAASGRPPLAYQWRFNGAVVPGANNPTLTLPSVDATRAGDYQAIVSNASGSVTSVVAKLEVKVQVVITQQPQSRTVLQGTDVSFSVTAVGTPPLNYQWQFAGVNLPGQTNSTLNLSNVTPANAGDYTVSAGNDAGSVTSAKATLTVSIPPTIVRQPQPAQSVLAGGSALFNITVSGTEPLLYQWRFNGSNIPEANAATFELPNVQTAASGDYSVVVSNAAGTVTSDIAKLAVTAPVAFVQHPQSQEANVGDTVTLFFLATGIGPAATYQWRLNGVDLRGATRSQLILTNVRADQAGRYSVIIGNAAGGVESNPATVAVNIPVTITLQPQSQTVNIGSSAVFTVAAVGSGAISYQWRYNGADLPGQTAAVLALSNIQRANAGSYSAVVRNVAGEVTSNSAALEVLAPPVIQTHPTSQNVPVGANVTFSVSAAGDQPLTYQWQKNGVSISGQTGSTLSLSNVQAGDAGSYSVVVENRGGAATSDSASLTLILPPLNSGNSAQSAPLPIESSEGSFDGGSNTGGGPTQFGLARKNAPPSLERWFAWKARSSGIVTFSTVGSTFDTKMTIYSGTPQNLTLIDSDDDRGGFFNSQVRFNAQQGVNYLIKVEGFEGATGRIVVSFKLEATQRLLPVIRTAPASQTVTAGSPVRFSVLADGAGLTYQWLFNDQPIANATRTELVLSNVQEQDAGRYTVRITAAGDPPLFIDSLPAVLQIVQTGAVENSAVDKFKSAPTIGSSGPQLQFSLMPVRPGKSSGGSVARGFTGSQVFSTFGATKEQGEPNHADVVGGASQWFTYQAPSTGRVRISTEGSNFDTLLAVYTGSGADFESLRAIASDNNSGRDGITSVVTASVTQGTTYFIAVDGVKGATGTVKLTYEFGLTPEITQNPARQDVIVGTNIVLSVQITNRLSGRTANVLSYEWIRDGLKLSNETNSTLILQNVQQSTVGAYAVIVSNLAGSATSTVAQVNVKFPVTITGEPLNQSVKAGSRIVFSVIASGSPTIGYQWRFNGADIAGATNANYVLNSVQPANVGAYRVAVRNDVSALQSQEAVLSITEPPAITTQPLSQIVLAGATANFGVVAAGAPPLNYQWRFKGVTIAGQTNATLVLTNALPSDSGEYSVVVNNAIDSAISAPAILTVNVPLTLTSLPRNQTVNLGSSAFFSVAASGTGPFLYQWRHNGNDLPGATNANLVLSNVQTTNSGPYVVEVATPAGFSVVSPQAILTINATPVITRQPASQVVFVGATNVTFSVTATGSQPLSYQWSFNGASIEGATASTLVLPVVTTAEAGNYTVAISNSAGLVVSELALLTVLDIIADSQFSNGVFQFRLSIPEGKRGTVQTSTDLVTWVDFGPPLNSGTVTFEDRPTVDSTFKYYRVALADQ